jgi:hypothetical protein
MQIENHFNKCCTDPAYAKDKLDVTVEELVRFAEKADARSKAGLPDPPPPLIDTSLQYGRRRKRYRENDMLEIDF